MNFFKSLLVTILIASFTMQSFAAEVTKAMEIVRNNYSRRMDTYNSNPLNHEIPDYTGTLNQLFQKGPSRRHATSGEKAEILKAIMGTALIHGDTMPIRPHGIDQSNQNIFRHHEIIRITQEVSQVVAGQIYDTDFSAIDGIADFRDIGLLKTYGGIEISDLKQWFTEVYSAHANGLTNTNGMHWRDPKSYEKLKPAATASATGHAMPKEMAGRPFSVQDKYVVYGGKQISFSDFIVNYERLRALSSQKAQNTFLIDKLPSKLKELGIDWSCMNQTEVTELCLQFVIAFREAYYNLTESKKDVAKKATHVPAQYAKELKDEQDVYQLFLSSRPDLTFANCEIAAAIAERFIAEKADHIDPDLKAAIDASLKSSAEAMGEFRPFISFITPDGLIINFEHYHVTGAGSCGFDTIGKSRTEVADAIMSYFNDTDFRQENHQLKIMIKDDLKESTNANNSTERLLTDEEIDNLFSNIPNAGLKESTLKKIADRIRGNEYVSASFLAICAKIFRFNLHTFTVNKNGAAVHTASFTQDFFKQPQTNNTILILSNGKAGVNAHYDLLVDPNQSNAVAERVRGKQLELDCLGQNLDRRVHPQPSQKSEKKFNANRVEAEAEEEKGSTLLQQRLLQNPRLQFTVDKAAGGLGILHPDLTRLQQRENQTIFDHFVRSYTQLPDGPAIYMTLLLNSNPYNYDAEVKRYLDFGLSEEEARSNVKAANASSAYGRMGPLALYIQYLDWAKETKAKPTPGYLGFDRGFAYNISHETDNVLQPHASEIELFRKNAEEAFSNGYVSYVAVVKNEHPTTRGGQHYWCVFATKDANNKIKDIYIFNPTVATTGSDAIDSSAYQSILMPLKGTDSSINIDAGNARLQRADAVTAFYTGDLNSFYTGIQSAPMACGISASLLARYFVTLTADQISTREKVIERLKEFQMTLGYNDTHLNEKDLYDSTLIEEDIHEGDYYQEAMDFGVDGRIEAGWVRYKEHPVIKEKDESRIKSLQTRAEVELCEKIKASFEEICAKLDGKGIEALPSVLQEYITQIPSINPPSPVQREINKKEKAINSDQTHTPAKAKPVNASAMDSHITIGGVTKNLEALRKSFNYFRKNPSPLVDTDIDEVFDSLYLKQVPVDQSKDIREQRESYRTEFRRLFRFSAPDLF